MAPLYKRARERGVNPVCYWIVRLVLQPFFHVYFRLTRVGREHIPQDGPVIFAANHRSFLDPFVIGTIIGRPMYFIAKRELFAGRLISWILSSLGAFPVARGKGDVETIATAKAILERGDSLLIFPEGTRIRPGPLGQPKRGVGRLALETGAPVVPVAVIGTEGVRRGWRIRPRRVRIRCGRPLTFPHVDHPSPQLAAAVTARIWPCVMLQWEWLGGVPPMRRAAVIGAGAWGTGIATLLARAGLEVDLGCRTPEQARELALARENARYLPGVELPEAVRPVRASELELGVHDLVCFAVPSAALPTAVGAHGPNISSRASVLVLSKGLVGPLGTAPSAYVSERVGARVVAALAGPSHAADALANGASVIVASVDRGAAREIRNVLTRARLDVTASRDVTGVELAACAKNAAVLAAAAAVAGVGPNAAGAAAGKVFAEVESYARRRGAAPESFAGLAGVGDLVGSALASGSRNRRAGELLVNGVPAAEIGPAIGHVVEAVDAVPLLAAAVRDAGVPAPALGALAELIEGRLAPERWTLGVTAPAGRAGVRAA